MTTTEKPQTLEQRLSEVAIPNDALRTALSVVRAVPKRYGRADYLRNGAVAAEIAQEVLDTGQWPEDAAQRLLDAERADDEARALGVVLWGVTQRLKRMSEAEARETTTGPQVDFLRAELDEIVRRVREVDVVLGDVRTPDDVIRVGGETVTAWAELDDLARQWAEVLRLHYRVVVPQGATHGAVYLARVPVPGAQDEDRAADPVRVRDLCTRRSAEIHLPTRAEMHAMTSGTAPRSGRREVLTREVAPGSGVMFGVSEDED